MAIANIDCAEHYIWGDHCDGWHLLQRDDLSVIRERMPPGTAEARHYHEQARQFFFILSGTGTIEIEGEVYRVKGGDGIEIPPSRLHCISNRSDGDLHFLVISAPKSHGDRVVVSDSVT